VTLHIDGMAAEKKAAISHLKSNILLQISVIIRNDCERPHK